MDRKPKIKTLWDRVGEKKIKMCGEGLEKFSPLPALSISNGMALRGKDLFNWS